MKISELRAKSKENISKNGLISIIVMFFCGLICGASMLIGLLFVDLIIFVVPLIVLPTMFAFQRAIIVLRNEETLTFSLVFSGYQQYFSPRFSSTYSFFKNLLWLLIVYVAVGAISMITVNIVFYTTNFMGYQNIIGEMIYANLDYEVIESIYESHRDFFEIYLMANSLPSLFAVAIMAFYFYSTTGHSFFLRVSGLKYPGQYLKDLFARVLRKYRGEFLKYYFALNWPMYILFLGGLAFGGYVGSVFRFTYGAIFTFAIAFAIFLSFGIYGAIYFANKEAIYTAFIDRIQKEDMIFQEEVKRAIAQMTGGQNITSLFKDLEDESKDNEDSDE